MPMIEKEIDGKHRMVIKPDMADLYPETIGMRSGRKSRDSKEAITRYKVLSERGNCALVQLEPETGEDLGIKITINVFKSQTHHPNCCKLVCRSYRQQDHKY